MSPVPHRIYSQELSNAFRRGHPIANPQPVDYSGDDERSDEEEQTLRPVEIGDVGYIQHDTGLFIRLFNVHLEPGVNGQPMRGGLPPDGFNFRPLRRGMISKSKDTTPVFVSQSVETVKLNAAASGPFFGGSAGFSASSNRGAILATPDPIECQNALNIPSYLAYAKAHIKEWHRFYSRTHQIELEDLILVTGVDRTTSWATAVFSDTSLNVGFGLDVQFAGAGGGLQLACQYSWRSTLGALVNAGPVPRSVPNTATGIRGSRIQPVPVNQDVASLGHNATQIDHDADRQAINTVSDQTLFIRHIRAKRRPWRGMKLEARGEKNDTDDGEDGEDESGDGVGGIENVILTSYPQRDKFVDCLEPALDYILEHSDSDIAVAHDQDLVLLESSSLAHGKPLIMVEDGIGILQQPRREPEEEGGVVIEVPSELDALDERIEGFNPGSVASQLDDAPRIHIDTNVPHFMQQETYYSNTLASPNISYMGSSTLFSPISNDGSSSTKSTPWHTPISALGAPVQAYAYYQSSSPTGAHPADTYSYFNPHSKEEPQAPSYPSAGQYLEAPQHSPTTTRYNSSSAMYSPSAMGSGSGSSSQLSASRAMSTPAVASRHGGSASHVDMVHGRGRMIPQSKYRPHTAADRDRYVNKIALDDPVLFNTTNPGVVGIALSDALAGKYQQLDGRDDRVFVQCGPSISIRVNWAGCYPAWSRQIPTRDFRNPPGPVTRSKVAKNVARSIERFIDEMNLRTLEEDADPGWAVGPARNGILLEDLALVRLEHVSKGSWQVHLCFVHEGIAKGGQ